MNPPFVLTFVLMFTVMVVGPQLCGWFLLSRGDRSATVNRWLWRLAGACAPVGLFLLLSVAYWGAENRAIAAANGYRGCGNYALIGLGVTFAGAALHVTLTMIILLLTGSGSRRASRGSAT